MDPTLSDNAIVLAGLSFGQRSAAWLGVRCCSQALSAPPPRRQRAVRARLHKNLMHAPDFLGYLDAIRLAKERREFVERGLALKMPELADGADRRASYPPNKPTVGRLLFGALTR